MARKTSSIVYHNLQALLDENNLTQKKFALIIDMSATTLNQKMTGRRKFTIDEVNKIIGHFQKTYEEIFLHQQTTHCG